MYEYFLASFLILAGRLDSRISKKCKEIRLCILHGHAKRAFECEGDASVIAMCLIVIKSQYESAFDFSSGRCIPNYNHYGIHSAPRYATFEGFLSYEGWEINEDECKTCKKSSHVKGSTPKNLLV